MSALPRFEGQPDDHRWSSTTLCQRYPGGALQLFAIGGARLLLRMNATVVVRIIGSPVACAAGVKESWREVAAWAQHKLTDQFGRAVEVEYYDLFDPACPPFPSHAQIPIVLINGEMFSYGGKISVVAIRKHVASLLGYH